MVMTARYTMIDDAELLQLVPEAIPEFLTGSSWTEADTAERTATVEEYWDLLHLVLTGFSASDPVEDNPLSEAVVGVENLDEDEDSEFVAITHTRELPDIVAALREIDVAKGFATLAITDDLQDALYPEGVLNTDSAVLVSALHQAQQTLINFYDAAATAGRHVVVTIV